MSQVSDEQTHMINEQLQRLNQPSLFKLETQKIDGPVTEIRATWFIPDDEIDNWDERIIETEVRYG